MLIKKTLIHFFNDNRAYFKIPSYVEVIGEYAFSECGLYDVDVPNNVKHIEDGAFERCMNLESIGFEYPSSLKSIGAGAFFQCRNLSSVHLPNSLETIGIQSFCDCRNLKTVNFPNGLKEISNFAFEGTSMDSVMLPKSLEKLGTMAFVDSNITDLQSLSPNFIIKNGAIFDKTGKTLLQYYGYEQRYEIPSSVESIGDDAFACAWSIRELIIPNTVKKIGKNILHQTLPKKILVASTLYDAVIQSTDSTQHSHIEIYNND